MKTLSRTFQFVVLGVIVIVVVASCCNFPFVTDTTEAIEIGHQLRANTPKKTYRTYVEWKNKDDFDKALAQVRRNNGKICICVVMPGGTPYPHKLNNDCPHYDCPFPENIRTVKVTKSKDTDKIAAAESALNDPHVTYKVQSPYPGDIITVLGTLK
jgi:NADPH:quinone reductase-like Zn-dependent oxidoreductase